MPFYTKPHIFNFVHFGAEGFVDKIKYMGRYASWTKLNIWGYILYTYFEMCKSNVDNKIIYVYNTKEFLTKNI